MLANRAGRWSILGLIALVMSLGFAGTASAEPFDDVTEAFAEAIGTTEYIGEFLLATAGLIAIGLALGVARLPTIPLVIVLLAAVGMFTIVGWLDVWVLILSAVLVAVYLASALKTGVDA